MTPSPPDDPNGRHPAPDEPLPDDLVDGLAAGFGRADSRVEPPSSILDRIARRSGAVSRIALRDEPAFVPARVLRALSQAAPGMRSTCGKYQLQGEIARGGIGLVLKGHDVDLGRDVAIKVLQDRHSDNAHILQRFVEEAQIGGQMQHPGIVPVYDIGVHEDRLFFSMKLVKGRTLSSLIDETADDRGGRLRLLRIFEQVCQTMAYAHARGVIHRDLKPANVMVGAFGEVQVVDWGMGKVLAAGGLADEARSQRRSEVSVIETVRSKPGSRGSDSLAGSVMGTPAYMPPEQANGDVDEMDERSDVFALGAILCEILTELPPYAGSAERQLAMAAAGHIGPCRERLAACGAAPELVELAVDCMMPAPMARPRSAEIVAERIAGYLSATEERAQQAKIEAAEQRVRAAAARRAQRLTLALAASVLLTLGLGVAGWGWFERDRADRMARADAAVLTALDEAHAAHGRAKVAAGLDAWEAAMAAGRHARDFAVASEVAPQFARSAEQLLAEIERERQQAAFDEQRRTREAATLALLEAVPLPPDELGGAVVGDLQLDCARRVDSYREIFAGFGLPLAQLSPAEAAARLAACDRPDAWAAAVDGWTAAALTAARDAAEAAHLVAIANAVDDDPRRAAVRALMLDRDAEPARLRRLAAEADGAPPRTVCLIAELLAQRSERDLAVEILLAAHERHPDDYETVWRLANFSATRVHQSHDRYLAEETLGFTRAALALRPDSATAWFMKGSYLRMTQRLEAAEVAFHRSLALDDDQSQAYHNLGHILQAQGRLDEARAMFERAADLDASANYHARESLANLLQQLGEHERARQLRREAGERRVAQARAELAAAPGDRAALINLGAALDASGRRDEAIEMFDRVLALDPEDTMALGNRANCLWKNGQGEAAAAALRRALAIDPSDQWTVSMLARVLVGQRAADEAIALLRDCAPSARRHYELAGWFLRLGRDDEAVEECHAAIRLDPSIAPPRINLGHLFKERGRYEAAEAVLEAAIDLSPQNHIAHYGLGAVFAQTARFPEAARCFRAAARMNPASAAAYWDLGRAHYHSGDAAAALEAFERGRTLSEGEGSLPKGWETWLTEARELAAALPTLEDILAGGRAPDDPAQALQAANLAFHRADLEFAARTYRAVAEADGDRLVDRDLFFAARAAALLGGGRGADLAAADDEARARWREQALAWFHACVQAERSRPTADSALAATQLAVQLSCPDFAGFRGPGLYALPEAEQAAWRAEWQEARALLDELRSEGQR